MRAPYPSADLDLVLERTRETWHEFRGSRLLLSGGTGFIGSWLLECLMHANRRLGTGLTAVVPSRDPRRAQAGAPHLFRDPAVQLVEGGLLQFALPEGQFDLCVHAATDVGDASKARRHLDVFDVNILGTRRMLELASARGVRRFLLLSSGAVYGLQPPGLSHVTESELRGPDPLLESSAYAEGKRGAEWLSAHFDGSGEMRCTVARIFALLGPGMPLDGPFAAGNFVRDVLSGRAPQITGDGSPRRSFLYVADACAWLLRMLCKGEGRVAYNLGSERVISVADFADLVMEIGAGRHPRGAFAQDSDTAQRYVPSTAKARTELGLEEWTPLPTALEHTFNWFKLRLPNG